MVTKLKCQNCGKLVTVKVKDMNTGKTIKCPHCNKVAFKTTSGDGAGAQKKLDGLKKNIRKLSD